MKRIKYPICAVLLLASCSGNNGHNSQNDSLTNQPAGAGNQQTSKFQNIEGDDGSSTHEVKVREIICFLPGKFSNSATPDTAYVIKIKEGWGNPAENGTPDEYMLKFTGRPDSVNIGCCDARLINEGDLNGDGKEEITVYQYPYNGCTTTATTFTNKNNHWSVLFEPFMIFEACEGMCDIDLQNLVTLDGGGNVCYQHFVDTTINGSDTFYPLVQKVIFK